MASFVCVRVCFLPRRGAWPESKSAGHLSCLRDVRGALVACAACGWPLGASGRLSVLRKFVKADCSSWAFAKQITGRLRSPDGERFVRVSRLVLRGGDLVQDDEPGALRGVPLLGQRSGGAEMALRLGHDVVPGIRCGWRVSKWLWRCDGGSSEGETCEYDLAARDVR